MVGNELPICLQAAKNALADIQDKHQDERGTPCMSDVPPAQAAKNALADIQDKHKDIMRLEASIVELHQVQAPRASYIAGYGSLSHACVSMCLENKFKSQLELTTIEASIVELHQVLLLLNLLLLNLPRPSEKPNP